MEEKEIKKEIVSLILKQGVLITERLVSDITRYYTEISEIFSDNYQIQKLLQYCEDNGKIEGFFSKSKNITQQINEDNKVNVLFSYDKKSEKKQIQDFVTYFNNRYNTIERMLRDRKELENLNQINKVLKKKDRETISIIGFVQEKSETKNGNIFLTIEDQTDTIKVLVNKTKPDLFQIAKDLVLDEVIGVKGVNGDGIIFANSIIHPDLPMQYEQKQIKEEIYAIFLSDIHIGSTYFLEEDFKKFLKWINGEMGNEKQRDLVSKIKYIFIIGDLVDGVGIYPGQEKELQIKDIYKQYEESARFLSMIPKDKKIIICPGNHDAQRISEPQAPLTKEYCLQLYDMPNITMVSNPAVVNIHSSKDFEGFNVLLYHGYSFDYYISEVDSIRNNGGYDRADLVMKFLLQRRHLAPTHASTLYIPEKDFDPLVIAPTKNLIPDIFATGHIHKSSVSKYRNVTLICGSCWQSTTPFQEKVGHHPEPSRVPIINLQNSEVKVIRFG